MTATPSTAELTDLLTVATQILDGVVPRFVEDSARRAR